MKYLMYYGIGFHRKFKAIDAIEVCDDEIYKDIGKISNGLVDTLVHKQQIKAILKDMI